MANKSNGVSCGIYIQIDGGVWNGLRKLSNVRAHFPIIQPSAAVDILLLPSNIHAIWSGKSISKHCLRAPSIDSSLPHRPQCLNKFRYVQPTNHRENVGQRSYLSLCKHQTPSSYIAVEIYHPLIARYPINTLVNFAVIC